jgi:hypothetical protein
MRPLVLTLLLSRAALADAVHVDFPYKGFFVDLGLGPTIPVAEDMYKRLADPTAVIGLYTGWELALHKHFMLAPELNLDLIPVNTNDATFNNAGYNASFFRVRFLVGARFVLRFGKAEPFVRVGFGVDWIGGTVREPTAGFQGAFASTGFTFKPAMGFQYEVARYVVVGGQFAFPVSGTHSLGNSYPLFYSLDVVNNAFTALDFDFMVYAGFRY